MRDLKYTDFTTPSGITVRIRPRTYEEWEKHEDERVAALRSIKNAGDGARIEGIEVMRHWRTALLECRVENFAGLKASLTMQDIDFIEQQAIELEKYEIPLGNSASGGGGQ